MNWLVISSIILYQTRIISTVGFGDLAILLFTLLFFSNRDNKKSFTLKKDLISDYLIIIFLLWIIVSAFIINEFEFSSAYFNRLLRFSNVILGFYVIKKYYYSNPQKFLGLIINLFYANIGICIIALIELMLIKLEFNPDFRLIYRDVEVGSSRIRAFYSEPSILSIVITFLNLIYFRFYKILDTRKIIIIFSLNIFVLFQTLSIIGLAGLLLTLPFFVYILFKRKILLKSSIFLLPLFFIVPSIDPLMIERLQYIAFFQDASANQRLYGSWSIPWNQVDNLYIGRGLGEERNLSDSFLVADFVSSYNQKINNALAFILYENGFIGMVIFCGFIISKISYNFIFSLALIYFCFSHGAYYKCGLWTVLAILSVFDVNFVQYIKSKNLRNE